LFLAMTSYVLHVSASLYKAVVKAVPCICLLALANANAHTPSYRDEVDWLALAHSAQSSGNWHAQAKTDQGLSFFVGEVSSSQTDITATFNGTGSSDDMVVIFTSTKDSLGHSWSVPRRKRSTATGFTAVLQSSTQALHDKEKSIGYLAIPQGTGSIGGRAYSAKITTAQVCDEWTSCWFGHMTGSLRVFGSLSFNLCSLEMENLTSRTVQLRTRNPTECGADARHGLENNPGLENIHMLVMEGDGLTTKPPLALELGRITSNTTDTFSPALSKNKVLLFPGIPFAREDFWQPMIVGEQDMGMPNGTWETNSSANMFVMQLRPGSECPTGRMDHGQDKEGSNNGEGTPIILIVVVNVAVIVVGIVAAIVIGLCCCGKQEGLNQVPGAKQMPTLLGNIGSVPQSFHQTDTLAGKV
jgi:hypothetical protein